MRTTLNAGVCDVVMGVPSQFEPALTTRSYYRSTYVFIERRDRALRPRGFDDPRLHHAKIGVHVVGDDYANVPPAQALMARGIVQDLRGYSVYGDYGKPNPPAALIDAVRDRSIDVAVVWGPLAGYFAAHSPTPLVVTPLTSPVDRGVVPLAFDISMGVRRNDLELKRVLDDLIVRRRAEIRSILARYHVPVIADSRSRSNEH
jgi:mxaJ protein